MDFSKYPPLALPEVDLHISRNESGKVYAWDSLRRRNVVLTPEEWVRQHFVAMLSSKYGYMRSRMANEVTLNVNGATRRCDTVIFDSHRRPIMVIEYKAADVPITQAVFDQIARYNMVLNARYLAVSNGITTYCCQFDADSAAYTFLPELPAADLINR